MIRVFPTRNKWTPTDELAFVGMPPLFRPGIPETPVRVSVTFTWERGWAERIAANWKQYYSDVRIGGPAYDSFAGDFVPGRFLKEGCTITSRGCPKRCGWCKVPFSEGALRLLPITPGWIVQDNNLLACPRHHTEKVFEMLRQQHRAISFNGGLDKDFLEPWHIELFKTIKIDELWFACDRGRDIERLERIRPMLDWLPIRKLRCYTMIGYDGESLDEAEERCERVLELGFMPFAQLYQPPTVDRPSIVYSPEWKAVNRKWSRPAAYMGSSTLQNGDSTVFKSSLA